MATVSANVKPPIRPYRRFLISAFHTRFGHASLLALLVCWDDAFWVGSKTSSILWSWFPLGPAGIRAVLFFFSSLAIFILHVATLEIGSRTSVSPFASFSRQLFSISTLKTLSCYILSAWWFSEVFIWSSPPGADLSWVKKGDMSTPDKLNERPIYLRGVFFLLALIQSMIHLYCDFSALRIPVSPLVPSSDPDQRTHRIAPLSIQLRSALASMIQRIALTSAATAVLGPFLYTLFLRRWFWSWHLMFAKLYYNLSRSDARPSGYAPARPSLILRSFGASVMLLLTWEATSFLFSALLAQQPLKKGQPLSTASKDPNGTLLNGIKAKRDVVKTFAFWELALIARSFPERRKAIFADIERANGPCWSQMQIAALDVIRGISIRIQPQATPSTYSQGTRNESPAKVEDLPKIVPLVSNKSIFANATPPRTSLEKLESASGTLAKSFGQSPKPWSPPIGKVKGLLEQVTPTNLAHEPAVESLQHQWVALQASPVGQFFKTSKQRKINAVVLGSGHATTALILDAVEIVTRMLVTSLSEDAYGKAIAGVPDAVRVFTKAISDTEAFVQKYGEGLDSGIEEVEIVVSRLKAGLTELLSAFQFYLSDVGLANPELTDARKAAEKRRLLVGNNKSDQATIEPDKSDTFRPVEAANSEAEQARPKEPREKMADNGRRKHERQDRPTTSRIERASDSGRGWTGRLNMNDKPLFAPREMEMVR